VDYLPESAVSIYRRRHHLRAVATLSCVIVLLVGTVVYAASYVQGWVGKSGPTAVAASCNQSTSHALKPGDVTLNVYNSTSQGGLAAALARLLERQGFKVATTDNDPLGKTITGIGEIRHGPSGTEAAIIVAGRFRGARLIQDDRADATVDLVIGAKFRNLSGPPKVPVSTVAKPKAKC